MSVRRLGRSHSLQRSSRAIGSSRGSLRVGLGAKSSRGPTLMSLMTAKRSRGRGRLLKDVVLRRHTVRTR